jgi:hypothetical protein
MSHMHPSIVKLSETHDSGLPDFPIALLRFAVVSCPPKITHLLFSGFRGRDQSDQERPYQHRGDAV